MSLQMSGYWQTSLSEFKITNCDVISFRSAIGMRTWFMWLRKRKVRKRYAYGHILSFGLLINIFGKIYDFVLDLEFQPRQQTTSGICSAETSKSQTYFTTPGMYIYQYIYYIYYIYHIWLCEAVNTYIYIYIYALFKLPNWWPPMHR